MRPAGTSGWAPSRFAPGASRRWRRRGASLVDGVQPWRAHRPAQRNTTIGSPQWHQWPLADLPWPKSSEPERSRMQAAAIVVALALTLVAASLFVRTIVRMTQVIRLGQREPSRGGEPVRRTVTMLRETVGHTKMLKWTWVGVAHWFVFAGFILLFATLVTAYGQLFDARFALPLIGH